MLEFTTFFREEHVDYSASDTNLEFSWISELILSSGQALFCAAQWVMETSHQSSYVEPNASIRDILNFPEPCEPGCRDGHMVAWLNSLMVPSISGPYCVRLVTQSLHMCSLIFSNSPQQACYAEFC